MAGSGKSGRERIQDGDAAEQQFVEAMTETIAEQSWPGIFSGGKQIVRTQAFVATETSPAELTFWFDDGSALKVVGDFSVRYKQPDKITEEILPQQAMVDLTKQLESSDEKSD